MPTPENIDMWLKTNTKSSYDEVLSNIDREFDRNTPSIILTAAYLFMSVILSVAIVYFLLFVIPKNWETMLDYGNLQAIGYFLVTILGFVLLCLSTGYFIFIFVVIVKNFYYERNPIFQLNNLVQKGQRFYGQVVKTELISRLACREITYKFSLENNHEITGIYRTQLPMILNKGDQVTVLYKFPTQILLL